MNHVILVETDDSFVITVDKKTADRFAIARAVQELEREAPDYSQIPVASDKEQAEVEQSLAAMTEEDWEPGMVFVREL